MQEQRIKPSGVRATDVADVAKQLQLHERTCIHTSQHLDAVTSSLQSSEYHFVAYASLQRQDIHRKAARGPGWTNDSDYCGPLLLVIRLKPTAQRFLTALAHFLEPLWNVHLATGLDAVEAVSRACADISRLWNTAKFPRRSAGTYTVPPDFAAAGQVTDPRTLVDFPASLQNVIDSVFQGMLIAETDDVAALLLQRHKVASVTVHGNVSRIGEFSGGYRVPSSQPVTGKVFAYQMLEAQAAAAEHALAEHKTICVAHSTMLALLQQQKKQQQLLRAAEQTLDDTVATHDGLREHAAQMQGTLDACLRHHATVTTSAGNTTSSSLIASAKQTLKTLDLKKKQVTRELQQIGYQVEELRAAGEEADSGGSSSSSSTSASSSISSSSTSTSTSNYIHNKHCNSSRRSNSSNGRSSSRSRRTGNGEGDDGDDSSSSTGPTRGVDGSDADDASFQLAECEQQFGALRQQRDRLQAQLAASERDEARARDSQAELKSQAEQRLAQLQAATAAVTAIKQQSDAAKLALAEALKRLRAQNADADATIAYEPIAPLKKTVQSLTREKAVVQSRIVFAEEQVSMLAPEFGHVDTSVLAADVARVGRDLEQLQVRARVSAPRWSERVRLRSHWAWLWRASHPCCFAGTRRDHPRGHAVPGSPNRDGQDQPVARHQACVQLPPCQLSEDCWRPAANVRLCTRARQRGRCGRRGHRLRERGRTQVQHRRRRNGGAVWRCVRRIAMSATPAASARQQVQESSRSQQLSHRCMGACPQVRRRCSEWPSSWPWRRCATSRSTCSTSWTPR